MAAGLGLSLGADASEARAEDGEDISKLLRVESSELAPVTFSKLMVHSKSTTHVAIAPEGFRMKFLGVMRKLGYPVVGAESAVFDQDMSDKARFTVGGTLQEVECASSGATRTCRGGIVWEVMNRRESKIVYHVLTWGSASGSDPEKIGESLVNQCFRSLLTRRKFVDSLRATTAAATEKAPWPSAQFRACSTRSLSMPEDTAQVLKATVLVDADSRLGSGALISPEGLLLTAAHVVEGSRTLTVQYQDGKRESAIVVRSDKASDVALLRANPHPDHPCLAVRSAPAAVGDEVYAIGSPLGKEQSFSLTRGMVSGVRAANGVALLQTVASVNRGNSGDPLVDKNGEHAGVVSWKVADRDVQGLAFGVPSKYALWVLGLVAGTTTDAALTRAPSVAAGPREVGMFVDEPDATPELPQRRASSQRWYANTAADTDRDDPEAMKSHKTHVTNLAIGSGVAGVAGVITLSLGAFTNKDEHPTQRTVLFVTGGTLLIGAVALAVEAVSIAPPTPKNTRSPNAVSKRPIVPQHRAWSAGLGPGFVTLQGSF